MKFESFLSDILSNIVGGGILTFLFFLIREKCFRTFKLDGSWIYTQKTEISEYNPYKNMELIYLGLVLFNNSELSGMAKKIYEKSTKNPNKKYTGIDRVRVDIVGYLEKRYFSKDKLSIQIFEHGTRESSTIHTLTVLDRNTLKGTFHSTIANQAGTVIWQRRSSQF